MQMFQQWDPVKRDKSVNMHNLQIFVLLLTASKPNKSNCFSFLNVFFVKH